MVIGWLRPVVLVPTAALAGLPPAQLEALLAHELAHVRRHDYLVNLLQAVVETLLFYHPAVWWVSRQVRAEREHCCDDIAVSVCDRVDYVSALSALAAIAAPPRLALAATDGRLVSRVRRLLRREPAEQGAASVWLSAAVAIALVVSIPAAMAALDWREGRAEPPAVRAEGVSADSGIQAGRVSEAPAPGADAVSAMPPEGERSQLRCRSKQVSSNGRRRSSRRLPASPLRSRSDETLERYRQATGRAGEEAGRLPPATGSSSRPREVRDEFESRRAELRSRIESGKQALAEARRKFAVGLVASEVPAAYQEQVQALERRAGRPSNVSRRIEQQARRLTAEQQALMRDYNEAAQGTRGVGASRAADGRGTRRRRPAVERGQAKWIAKLAERLQPPADRVRERAGAERQRAIEAERAADARRETERGAARRRPWSPTPPRPSASVTR